MKPVFVLVLAMAWLGWVGVSRTSAAQQTWIGTISDSQCGQDHGTEVDERRCTERCIQIGYEYVFVPEGQKPLKIANQKFAGLPQHAGHKVRLTGEQKSGAILVSKIEMPPRAKSK